MLKKIIAYTEDGNVSVSLNDAEMWCSMCDGNAAMEKLKRIYISGKTGMIVLTKYGCTDDSIAAIKLIFGK